MIRKIVMNITNLTKEYLKCAESKNMLYNLIAFVMLPFVLVFVLGIQAAAAVDTWYDFKMGGLE